MVVGNALNQMDSLLLGEGHAESLRYPNEGIEMDDKIKFIDLNDA